MAQSSMLNASLQRGEALGLHVCCFVMKVPDRRMATAVIDPALRAPFGFLASLNLNYEPEGRSEQHPGRLRQVSVPKSGVRGHKNVAGVPGRFPTARQPGVPTTAHVCN